MSFAALAAGIVYYLNRRFLFELHERYLPDLQSPVAFERVYQAMTAAAARVMALVDSGAPRRYLAPLLVFAIALGLWAYWSAHPDGLALAGTATGAPAGPLVQALALAGLAALAAGCLGVVACHRQRLLAIIFMSVVGLVVSMTFVLLSAPDLALTQISVEVVTIVVMLLALRFLPARADAVEPRGRRLRDVAIAGLAGGGVAALSYAMLTRPFETISNFYLANAVPGGGGANAVNVILVDFRGFDTLGEITVLAMAALGAHALVSGLRLAPYAGSAEREADRHPIMLAMLVRPLLPLALAVSLYILLRGHNLPGGGFIAGLVTSVALILQYIACGIDFGRARLPLDQPRLIAAGLAIAGATGLASWLFGAPFLTSAHGHVHLPLIGDVELASAMLFDLGVYLVVVGGTLLVLTELGALSRRELAAEGATREAATREPATQEPAPWS
jgi:multicomponent K+:H+ antiporter subunit A